MKDDDHKVDGEGLKGEVVPPKGDLILLLRRIASTKTCLIVRLCKSDSASTTGIQDPGAERKMFFRDKSQANGMSSRYKKHLSMSIMTFLQIGST